MIISQQSNDTLKSILTSTILLRKRERVPLMLWQTHFSAAVVVIKEASKKESKTNLWRRENVNIAQYVREVGNTNTREAQRV